MEDFATLVEFSVAIAGFSGIAIAIRSRDEAFGALDRFRQRNLILYSLCAAFGATFPAAASQFGAVGPDVWRWSSLLFACAVLVLGLMPFVARAQIPVEQRAKLSRVIWVLAVGGSVVSVGALMANVLAVFGPPGPAPLYLTILWHILMAALMFYRLLFAPGVAPNASTER